MVAVVYSHSHADHFGGVRGVVDEADVHSGKVKIIAPIGFRHHAISENVMGGNAMNRRMFYQYGVLLPRSPYGHVDQSIGKNTATGSLGLITPNVIIKDNIEEMTVDGVRMVFQNTPGTEAPAEMNTWFPDLNAFWAAENTEGVRYIINFITPDNGEKYVVELNNATLTNIKGFQAKDADLTITINRSDLNSIMLGQATFDQLIEEGKARFEGNRAPFDLLKDSLVQFDMGFEILPGTGAKDLTSEAKAFEQTPLTINAITD